MSELEVVVSICMITYNHEKYIAQAIEGVIMQNTTFPIELIIGEDCSTDNTRKICLEYKAKYPDIIRLILPENNLGVKRNFRETMQAANGKYIALCEGDDFWIDPLKLQKQIDFMEKNEDYSLCGHNAIILKTGMKKNEVELFNHFLKDTDINIGQLVSKWSIPTASIVVRKEVALYNPDWCIDIYSCDYKLLLLSFFKGKIKYFEDVMSVYRIISGGLSLSAQIDKDRTFVMNQHLSLLESFNKGTEYLYSHTINNQINHLKNEIAFHNLKSKSLLLALFFNPSIFITKLHRKAKKTFTDYKDR